MPEAPNPKIRPSFPAATTTITAARPRHGYAELDVTTNFSFLRGASHPDELMCRAAELGYRAVAVTDVNSLAGVVRAHAAAKQLGIKLLVGARLTFTDAPDLLVWAADRAGYGRLCRLITLGRRRAQKGECSLALEDFLEHSEGLLAAAMPPPSYSLSPVLRDTLGDRLSLAGCCPHGPDDAAHLGRLAELSRATGVPLVATNHVHYHDPGRRALQDVLTCVRHGCTVQEAGYKLFPNGERYLKPPDQMHRLFADYPQALRRGLEIAERCEFSLDSLKYEYPDELVPPGKTATQYLTELTWAGAAKHYPDGVPEKVYNQIVHELNLIQQLKFEAYFLTCYDLVVYARSRGILCQGRGSAANSAVCYCLGVTAVDPAKIDLLFERFISAARNEPPDIDIDFEHERREEVIQYLYEKYGRERAGMTATVITYRGRSAIRDVGKAMGLSLDMVDSMASRLDWWHRGVLADDQIREVGLDPNDQTVRRVITLAAELLGFPRHLSQHVGGMVMTRGPLCEMVPIENAAMEGRTVIEWDKDDIDEIGILKVDALALGMLTCISKAFRMVDAQHTQQSPATCRGSLSPDQTRDKSRGSVGFVASTPLQLHTIPHDDPGVYAMISDADTIGVFQVESRAQMSMLSRLRPRNFYDLVIEVAIVRPGPIQGNMVHPYLRRRNGDEPVEYPSPALRDVLQRTLGVPLFQEQAMKLAMVAAGFSADEADQLRRAMAAWRRTDKLLKFHGKIVEGMTKNGYTKEFAERCFEQIKGFGEYGFPESHAASFALLVYVSAWLKRYHPAAFAAALLNSQPMGFYMPAQIVRDAKEHGVEVRAVDVNASEWDCTLEPCSTGILPVSSRSGKGTRHGQDARATSGPAVRLGFRQLKGMRLDHAERIVACREKHGPFASVPQFHQITRLPVSALRTLAEADAFGSLGLSRREALWQVLRLKDDDGPLFDESDDSPREPAVKLPAMPVGQEVMTDYATAGLSLKRHPVSLVREELTRRKVITAAELMRTPHDTLVRVAGLVLIRQRPGTASGVVFATLEDETGVVNLIVWPAIFDAYAAAARHATLLQADGQVQRQGQVVHVIARRMHDLSGLIAGYDVRSRDFH